MRRAAESEAAHARELLPLVKADPVIGYESSNHYFYVPQDLLEKQINVRFVLDGTRSNGEIFPLKHLIPRNS